MLRRYFNSYYTFRYALQSLCDAAENCVRVLLGSSCVELSDEAKQTKPNENAVKCLEKVVEIQGNLTQQPTFCGLSE